MLKVQNNHSSTNLSLQLTQEHIQKTTKNLETSIDMAITEMPNYFVIKKFLLSNKAEVKSMFLTEWDQEKVLAQKRQKAEYMTHEQVAKNMLIDNYPLPAISKISKPSLVNPQKKQYGILLEPLE